MNGDSSLPFHQEPVQTRTRTRKVAKVVSRKITVALFIGLFILIGSAILITKAAPWRDKSPIPIETRQSVSYPLYYPSETPKGYTLDVSSVSKSEDLIVYKVTDDNGTITISQQSLPKDFNINAFAEENMQNHRTITIDSGKAVSGTVKNQTGTVIVISTKETLVFINSADITKEELEQTARSMVRS